MVWLWSFWETWVQVVESVSALCTCVFPSYFPSVRFDFVTYKMSEIILFLVRLYKNRSEVAQLRPHGLHVAYRAPLSMGFSRQWYWGGLPFPSPGVLPDPGSEPWSPTLQADAFTVWNTREVLIRISWNSVRLNIQNAWHNAWHIIGAQK